MSDEGQGKLVKLRADNWTLGQDQPKPRRQRKPSLKRQIKAVEATGKAVTSITLADGTKLGLDEPVPTEAANPWLVALEGKARQ
jgi:hypothetical protein